MWPRLNQLSPEVHAPEGDGGAGGGGGEDDKGKGGDLDSKGANQQVELLTKAVGMLAQGQEELKKQNESLTKALENFGKPLEKETVVLDPNKMFEGIDMTTMDNSSLANLVLQKATAIVEAKMKEMGTVMDGKVGDLATSFHSKNAAEAINSLKGSNPDLFEWRPEIKQVMETHPSLDIKAALTIARSENPEKVAAMTKKYAKPVESTRVSFAPSGTRSGDGVGKMSQAEAAEKAFSDVFGGTEHLLNKDTKLF